jgi:hypothetical protein
VGPKIDCRVRSSPRQTTFRNLAGLAVLVAAGLAVSSTALMVTVDTCPPCFSAQSTDENFDNVTPPVLPTGWLATNTLGPPPLWVTSNSGLPSPPADTPPNSAFVDDPGVLSDKRIDSLSVIILGCCCQMTFRHNYDLEASAIDHNVGFVVASWRSAPTVAIRSKTFWPRVAALLRAVTTEQSLLIGAALLQVVKRGAATRRALSRLS